MSRGLGLARLQVVIVMIATVATLLSACQLGEVPATATEVALASPAPSVEISLAPTSEPTLEATPTLGPPTPAPTVAPTPTWPVWLPGGSPLPPTVWPDPTPTVPPPPPPPPTHGPTPPPTEPPIGIGDPVATGNGRATRIVIPALNIDLPIILGNPSYPKCNVAQILDAFGFVNPGHAGTTYLYGHARKGMFLPLLDRSKINNGASMIGMVVRIYTKDLKLHTYVINIVKRHAVDFSLALDLKPGQHRLIMQTSEGPHGTIPKLQVAAKPTGVFQSTAAAALPTPHPVTCG